MRHLSTLRDVPVTVTTVLLDLVSAPVQPHASLSTYLGLYDLSLFQYLRDYIIVSVGTELALECALGGGV